MDFLKTINRRSFLSEVIYIVLNVGLALALLFIIRTTGSLLFALMIVLLSMWRIFAVRTRFWFANIQANLVSMIVSASFVVLLYSISLAECGAFQIFIIQIVTTLLYTAWLLFLKPQSKRVYVVAQAGVALFMGTAAIYSASYILAASPVVLLMWLVGYATARHVLSSYDEENHSTFLSIVWGFMVAEVGWLAYHWTIAYRIPFIEAILLPQVSIIVLCLGFVAYKSYDSFHHYEKIRMNDIFLPLIFSIGIICVLMLAFNGVLRLI
jgi:hypothetical protein